ncbi:LysR family transcriptional regulator (plasmid) [Polaromonas sp. P1-6]|nr:LysR family transcriptional regulator [Polaromonas sp. P1-6]
MNVSLRQMRAFVAVASCASFTGAAKQLHLSQSALSLLIKDLESELGVRLIERTTRNVVLSEVGNELLPLIKQVLQDLDRAINSVADLKDLKRGMARIAAPQLMSFSLLPPSWRRIARHPGVQVRLVECQVEQIEARITIGEADFGVGPERVVGPDIEVLPLMKVPVMLVCTKDHPLALVKRVTWKDVMAHPFIAMGGEYGVQIDRDLQAHSKGLSLNPSHEVAYVTTALSMVRSGFGVTACLTDVQRLASSYDLIMRPLFEPKMVREFCIYLKRGRVLTPAATSLLECVRDMAHQH